MMTALLGSAGESIGSSGVALGAAAPVLAGEQRQERGGRVDRALGAQLHLNWNEAVLLRLRFQIIRNART